MKIPNNSASLLLIAQTQKGAIQEIYHSSSLFSIALLISGVALLTIALSIQTDRKPSSALPGVGTISTRYIEAILYSSSFSLMMSQLAKQACQSVKQESILTVSEPSAVKNSSVAVPNYPLTEESSSMSWDSPFATAHSHQYSFVLNGQNAILHGMYERDYAEIKAVEEKLVQELQSLHHTEPESLKKFLHKKLENSNDNFVLQIGDSVIVSGKNFIVMKPTTHLKCDLRVHITEIFNILTGQKAFVMLGSREALHKISVIDAHYAYQDALLTPNPGEFLAHGLLTRIGSKDIAFMLLTF